jgi:hypothetical protein
MFVDLVTAFLRLSRLEPDDYRRPLAMWIKIPAPIIPVNLDTGEPLPKNYERFPDGSLNLDKPIADTPWTIQRFMAKFIFSNPNLGDDGDDLNELVFRLRLAFYAPNYVKVRTPEGTETWTQADAADLAKVRDLIKKPNGDGKKTREPIRWPADMMSQFVPFTRALAQAQHEDPRSDPRTVPCEKP